jgi:hypothetical protein
MVELVPSVDELFLIYEFGLDEVDKGKDCFEIYFFLGCRIALV